MKDKKLNAMTKLVNALENELNRGGDPRDQAAELGRVGADLEAIGEKINAEQAEIRAEFAQEKSRRTEREEPDQTPRCDYHETKIATACLVAAWCVVIFDWLFGGWSLMVGAALLAVVAFTIGGVLAVALAKFFKGPLSAIILSASRFPREVKRRLRLCLVPGAALFIAGVLFLWLLRNSTGGLVVFLGILFGPAMAVIAIVAMFLAGTLFVASSYYGFSKAYSDLYEKWDHLALRVDALRRICAQRLARLGNNRLDAPAQARSITRSVASVALAIAIWISISSPTKAQTHTATMPVVSTATLLAEPATKGVVLGDISPSISPKYFTDAVAVVKNQLSNVSTRYHVSEWSLIPFFDDAWASEATLVDAPAPTANCKPQLNEAERMWVQLRLAAEHKAEEECSRQRKNYAERLDAAMDKIFSEPTKHPPYSRRCTSLLDAISRITTTQDPTVAVLITDGAETCSPIQTVQRPSAPVALVVVLVPSKAEFASGASPKTQFDRRRAYLLKAAPWLSAVLPYWAFTADSFGRQ